jgi:hypothetical protein
MRKALDPPTIAISEDSPCTYLARITQNRLISVEFHKLDFTKWNPQALLGFFFNFILDFTVIEVGSNQ